MLSFSFFALHTLTHSTNLYEQQQPQAMAGYAQPSQGQQQPMVAQGPAGALANKRAGQEQVMRAYGVKGGAGVGPPGPMMGGGGMGVGAGMAGAAGGGSSYSGHPNRHYAPTKR